MFESVHVLKDEAVQLSIIRHPALFTDSELLLELNEEKDYEIPERYLEKVIRELQANKDNVVPPTWTDAPPGNKDGCQ